MPPEWTFGVFEVRARARVSLETRDVHLAALNGQLECLKYAREHGCPWDEYTCTLPPNGHLECLKYAREHGCPWNEEDVRVCRQNGHLECLKYAHEHGCPWDEETCEYAADMDIWSV